MIYNVKNSITDPTGKLWRKSPSCAILSIAGHARPVVEYSFMMMNNEEVVVFHGKIGTMHQFAACIACLIFLHHIAMVSVNFNHQPTSNAPHSCNLLGTGPASVEHDAANCGNLGHDGLKLRHYEPCDGTIRRMVCFASPPRSTLP